LTKQPSYAKILLERIKIKMANLEQINGADAVEQLEAMRRAQHEEATALHREKQVLLAAEATKSVVLPPEKAREVADQAKINTGQVPVVKTDES
jgi:uncharacterized membrane-anchored protein